MMCSKGEGSSDFVQLLTSNQEVVRFFIVSMVPNYQDVSDILQNVNLRLWQQRDKYEPGSNFGAWACTVARYEVLSYRHQLKRQNRLVFSDLVLERIAETAPDHQDPQYHQDKRNILHICLKKLNRQENSLLKARYVDGHSVTGLAESLKTTAQSLRVTLHRIRHALRACVKYHEKLGELRG